jgi:hypothetical protein
MKQQNHKEVIIMFLNPGSSLGNGGMFLGIFAMIVPFISLLGALLGLYALFLFIQFLSRAIQALDIYLDEKRGGRRLY